MDKKTVRRVVIIALAVLLVEQIFFLICGFGLPAQYGDTFMGELKSKYERLKETMYMLVQSVDAFVNKDMDKAKEVIAHDDIIDELFGRVKKELINMIHENAEVGKLNSNL